MIGRLLASIILILLPIGLGPVTPLRAQAPNHVGLVIRFGEDDVITRCISFSEEELSGYDVLLRSGLTITTAFDPGAGVAVCAIENTGCPEETCLTCAMPNYWSYWHLLDGNWTYSQIGASNYTVHPGDVEGWSWGVGDSPPPIILFDQICVPPTPPPTSSPSLTPIPTAPPSPTATPTAPPPTATPLPTSPPTPVVWFRLDENPIPVGGCTVLRWDTSGAQKVYLDEEPVSTNGHRTVCPTAPQEYRLRVVAEAGEQTHTLTLGVTGATATATPLPTPFVSAATVPPTRTPSPTSLPTSTPSPSPSSSPPPPPSPTSTITTSPTETPVPPSPTPPPTLTPSPFTEPPHPPTATLPAGYIPFAVIIVALLGLLAWGHRRP